jgi:hypothetical protein
VLINRNGREQTLTLRAEAAPESPAKDERVLKGRNPFDGATVVNLSPAVAQDWAWIRSPGAACWSPRSARVSP